MEIKRSVTNLRVSSDLQLPRSDLKKAFLHVFNHGFKGDPYVFMMRLLTTAFLPEVANDASFGKDKKLVQGFLKKLDPASYASRLRVQKVFEPTPHFRISVPLFAMTTVSTSSMYQFLRDAFVPKFTSEPGQLPNSREEEVDQNLANPNLTSKFYPGSALLTQARWMESVTKMELADAFLGLKAETKGAFLSVFAEFKISVAEAQQLSSTEWMSIRTIDLYPLILHWIVNAYGHRGRPLISSFPISSIAQTLPADHSKEENVRIDKYGLTISQDGHPLLLPRVQDNTTKYEDLYTQAGQREDGSYSLQMPLDTEAVKLPVNMSILVDWQNLKFAYSNTRGMLTTMDLARFHKMNAAHAAAILHKKLDFTKFCGQVASLALTAGVSIQTKDYIKEEELLKMGSGLYPANIKSMAMDQYFAEAANWYKSFEGQDVVLLEDFNPQHTYFAPFYRFFKAVYEASLNNLEAIYHKYSVSYTVQLLGMIGCIVHYAADLDGLKLEDAKLRSAALNQGADKDWQPPAIPLLSDRVGMLPHQKKVRNLLKDSPDLAILPVQAGGGKSMLAITDILYEIKAGTNAPYLILCPGHLVAQYVKEIVFFTGGKLNAVPITTYVIRSSGYERLGKILEAAPRNTVVVCDYDALRYRAANTIYGTSPTTVYPVIEFLRQFGFGYCLLDESHVVKNNSSRTKAAMMLIADIPKKRLASGTMAHDSPSDLALQVAMLDPTLFGTREEFNESYGEEVRGDRVSKWRPNAAVEIMAKIRSRVVVAGAMRKEWAALLPQPQEKFLRVDLSPAQLEVYNSILQETLELIKEEAKTNKALARFVDPQAAADYAAQNRESPAEDEEESESLESLLKPYLARLEQFMTAPARDPLGDKLLQGDDRISPKVRMIAERIRLHLQSGAEGKVLIFTNYTAGAEEIFNNMPEDLKSSGILYTAAEKIEKGAQFETSAGKKWMVGVENSMNTGLNLQFVSRLIRVDTVWNPGTLEQGNSRINRPELKKADRRDSIYYDWIVANNTIDCTKIARLISKIVSIAKFENATDGNYQGLPDVEVIAMSLDNIQTLNQWDASLLEYFNAYKDYKQVQAEDYAQYREMHGEMKLEPVEVAETPSDAMLLRRVPYVPGLELYGQNDLGLVRVDEYLRLEPEDEDEGAEEKPDDEMEDADSVNPLAQSLVGRYVHTEFGDGEVLRVGKALRRMRVRLPGNILVVVRTAAAFLINRKETSTKDIRNQVLKSIGQMPVSTPIDVPAAGFKPIRLTKKELMEQQRREAEEKKLKPTKQVTPQKKAIVVELFFTVSNGFLGISYEENEDMPEASKALQAFGFRPNPPFVYAEVDTAQRLVKQFDKWKAAGFTLDKKLASSISESFRSLHLLLKNGSVGKHRAVYKFSQESHLTNFYRTEYKPNNDSTVIKPFPLIEDGTAYIVLPVVGQSGTREAIRVKAPGIRWQHAPKSLAVYVQSMDDALNILKKVVSAGIDVSNLDDMKQQFTKIRKVQFRAESEDGFAL